MQKVRTILVDDESLALKRVELLLQEFREFDIISFCTDGNIAIEKINELNPDLIFLDVNLIQMTGFDVLKNIKHNPLVIFITAYDKHAIKAFDYFAFDFLLKPFKDARFYKCIERIQTFFLDKDKSAYNEKFKNLVNHFSTPKKSEVFFSKKLPVKLGNKIHLVPAEEIIYILASGYYSEIYTENKKYVLRDSITNLTDQLENYPFARIHRSTIISFEFIQELVYSSFGELDVKMKNNELFRVSKGYKKEFFQKLGI